MNLHFYLEKLHDSDEFQEFMIENPDSYLCSCFFEVSFSNQGYLGEEKQHLDFYAPTLKKIFSFKLEEGFIKEELENFNSEAPKKLGLDYEIDFKKMGKMISTRMEQEKINKEIQKLLISLQKFEGKDVIVITAFISGMGMLKVVIDSLGKEILEFEKKSFFDVLKITRKNN